MGGRPTLDLRLPCRRRARAAGAGGCPADSPPQERAERAPQPRADGGTSSPELDGAELFLFGGWLVSRGLLGRAELSQALALSRLYEWRVGDAVVVLQFASRPQVELEAKRFERHVGRREPRRHALEQRARRLEHEEQARRVRRAAAGDRRQG